MNYFIYSKGKNVDYKWSAEPDSNFHDSLRGNGISVARENTGEYTVYLESEPSAATDYQGRWISIGILVTGCTQEKAKGIAVWALEHWDKFCEVFERFVVGLGTDEWNPDSKELEWFFTGLPEIAVTGKVLDQRYKNGNSPESRQELAKELKEYDFSKTAGFKLIADGDLMTGGNLHEIQKKVQRYLTGDGGKEFFRDEPPQPTPNPHQATKIMKSPKFIVVLMIVLLVLALVFVSFLWGNDHKELKTQRDLLAEEVKTLREHTTKISNFEQEIENLNGEISAKGTIITELNVHVTNAIYALVGKLGAEIEKYKYAEDTNAIQSTLRQCLEKLKEWDKTNNPPPAQPDATKKSDSDQK